MEPGQNMLAFNREELFRVTPDGEVEVSGQVVTDDDSVMADLLRAWVKVQCNVVVRERGD